MPSPTRWVASASLKLLAHALTRLGQGNRSALARSLMRDRYAPEVRVLAGFFDSALLAWKNKQYVPGENGEEALLARLAPFAPRLLIDVGANTGEWTLAACRHLPTAEVHAFEIAPPTAEILARNIAPHAARVVLNRVGLGDRAGPITLYVAPDTDTASSTMREAVELSMAEHGDAARPIATIAAEVITGDAYLTERGITHVDLLKIDVEGAEAAVLAGFEGAFARGAIDMVQFEYGPLNLVNRHLLADWWHFFAERGFAVGKLLPEGVAFKPFEWADEDFIGPNYIACREARTDLIAALRCPVLRLG